MANYTPTHLLLAALTLASAVSAQAQDHELGFYERKAEGWFWYAQEPEALEKEESKLPTPQPESPPQLSKPEKAAPQLKGPAIFSAAWFRENLQKYKDAAWDNPTVENVRAFLYLQRFAIDRSEQFSDSSELAVLGDPFLDEITRRPAATFASQKVDREAGIAQGELLKRIAARTGIFFFFKLNCDYCDLQAPLVKMLEQSGGFTVVPVSIDGKPLPSHLFSNMRADNGHAKRLGVVTYPAIYLASPEGEFAPVGQGLMSLPELNHRILVAAKRSGWISEAEFNKTRSVLNLETNIAALLGAPEMRQDLTEAKNNQDSFIPPQQLMRYIRENLEKSVE
jgi:conjugal transfer pilus assembly protein TraF